MSMNLLDRIKQKKQAIASKTNRDKPAKLASAKNYLRILPRWDGDPDGIFFHDFGQHFIKDQAGSIQAVYICTANTFGAACDVCQALAEAASDAKDEPTVKAIAESKGSSRVLVNAIYINGSHPNPTTDPVLVELPPTVFAQILTTAEEYMEQHQLNIFSLKDGYDVTVTKEGSGTATKYGVIMSPKSRAVDPGVLAKCKNLEDYVKQEYDAGRAKALSTINAISKKSLAIAGPSAGGSNAAALSKPGGGATPSLGDSVPLDMDELDALVGEATTVAVKAPAPVAAAPAPAPVAAPAPAAPAPSVAGGAPSSAEIDEIEALLNGK